MKAANVFFWLLKDLTLKFLIVVLKKIKTQTSSTNSESQLLPPHFQTSFTNFDHKFSPLSFQSHSQASQFLIPFNIPQSKKRSCIRFFKISRTSPSSTWLLTPTPRHLARSLQNREECACLSSIFSPTTTSFTVSRSHSLLFCTCLPMVISVFDLSFKNSRVSLSSRAERDFGWESTLSAFAGRLGEFVGRFGISSWLNQDRGTLAAIVRQPEVVTLGGQIFRHCGLGGGR